MAKAAKTKPAKPRADKYNEKLKFSGTFEDLIKLSIQDAEKKTKKG